MCGKISQQLRALVSCRRPRFDSQYHHGGWKLPRVLGDPMPSSDSGSRHACGVHTYHADKTSTHIKEKKNL